MVGLAAQRLKKPPPLGGPDQGLPDGPGVGERLKALEAHPSLRGARVLNEEIPDTVEFERAESVDVQLVTDSARPQDPDDGPLPLLGSPWGPSHAQPGGSAPHKEGKRRNRAKVQDQKNQGFCQGSGPRRGLSLASAYDGRLRRIRQARWAAPKPLSMFTTPTPEAHEFSMARRAASP